MSEPVIIKQILMYSDGTEKVIEMNPNPNGAEIERVVAEAQAENEATPLPEDFVLKVDEPEEVPAEEIDENLNTVVEEN